ncbi:M20/M25/M40 family metallo-hydrolase [Deinococcus cellulosilyticus]|uniref:Acetylornithine deacetylase n=1 Tax=Deinococcus cellulosilyticus (strain DSM 18568 / NBRC 106333 / KACC 11606 / 5516J-15) TaxID=1223518 RepID=A0A511MYR6_DEIC1|nr:M20/M25/M40 family metallo-hydrolase [Deinococcus cellulosilyticus]GEM45744.1 acetylornithine deacetylase [Deinococcus cellulosilyticus NBRC 106333 = KACC 11606]
MLADLVRIAQTPAPSHQEHQRAALIAAMWQELGYTPQQDEVGNVFLKLGPTEGKALLLSAHLDTVFGFDVPHVVQERNGRLVGPGVGDNSASLTVLTRFLKTLKADQLRKPLWVLANVGEEGLGDLKGIKHFLQHHHQGIHRYVALDGYLGMVVTQTVGSKRYKVTFKTPGGHSWGDNAPSAVHALGAAIAQLYAMQIPREPRTTLNVGTVSGGTSVNTIAGHAEFLLDLRSLDVHNLTHLEAKALDVIRNAAREVGASVDLERVGNRPAGDLQNHDLVRLIKSAGSRLDLDFRQVASSTDANAAVTYGIPAVAMGVYLGGNAHRQDEWVQPSSMKTGLALLQQVVEAYQKLPE